MQIWGASAAWRPKNLQPQIQTRKTLGQARSRGPGCPKWALTRQHLVAVDGIALKQEGALADLAQHAAGTAGQGGRVVNSHTLSIMGTSSQLSAADGPELRRLPCAPPTPDELGAPWGQLSSHKIVQHLAGQVQAALLLGEAVGGAGALAVQDLDGQLHRRTGRAQRVVNRSGTK